jgi:Core-2/I-Branching enzyme
LQLPVRQGEALSLGGALSLREALSLRKDGLAGLKPVGADTHDGVVGIFCPARSRAGETMTVAYCIAAHTKPSQCQRLVQRLLADDPGCRVLVHYDQKHSSFDFRQVASPRVRVVPERTVYWGGSQVADLYIDMFRLAVDVGCSSAVMLSGQDYPLRHLAGLEADLSVYDVWADTKPLFADDGSCNWAEGRRRYAYRWWHLYNAPRVLRGAERVATKAFRVPAWRIEPPLPKVVHARQGGEIWWGARTRGPGVPIFIGSMWMSLSARAVEVLLSCPKRVASFFHHVPVADEAYFHTVLGNATDLTFACGNARYIRWTEGEAHPAVLTVADLDSMVASGAHFARKFDEEFDSSVLDRLDVLSRSSGRDGADIIDNGISPA